MQKMFHRKSLIVAKVQLVETQRITTYVNVVDVNVTIRCKVAE